MKIGEKLKFLRNKKDYTLKQLSQITGVSISFISDIENGRRIPGLEYLDKLAVGLGVSSATLIADSNIDIPNKLESNGFDSLTDEESDEISSYLINLTDEEHKAIHDRPELIELLKATMNSSREDILKTIRILKALNLK